MLFTWKKIKSEMNNKMAKGNLNYFYTQKLNTMLCAKN